MSTGYFETYPSGGQWRWRLVSSNGRIIATAGESYVNYSDCERSIEIVRIAGRDNWLVYEAPQGPFRGAFYIYPDAAGEFRWKLYATNGPSVAASSEGYSTRAGARDSVALTKSAWNWPAYRRAA
jgi:uncharacterized protein YegP (UPF0339 family)